MFGRKKFTPNPEIFAEKNGEFYAATFDEPVVSIGDYTLHQSTTTLREDRKGNSKTDCVAKKCNTGFIHLQSKTDYGNPQGADKLHALFYDLTHNKALADTTIKLHVAGHFGLGEEHIHIPSNPQEPFMYRFNERTQWLILNPQDISATIDVVDKKPADLQEGLLKAKAAVNKAITRASAGEISHEEPEQTTPDPKWREQIRTRQLNPYDPPGTL